MSVHSGDGDEDAYRALLSRHAAVPGQIAAELGTSTTRVTRTLGRLRDHGLVGRLSGHRLRYAAIDPHNAVAPSAPATPN
ncbi:helix-turn-helix domain-containing protein [Streptomyces sp. NPDC058486]|uniref:helix-turn-helix domain-containing protein n=1 Tax=unclassified Streptomyces TaxID=2593676 RepID=UPI00366341FB